MPQRSESHGTRALAERAVAAGRVGLAIVVALAGMIATKSDLRAQGATGGVNASAASPARLLHRTSDFSWLTGSWEGHLVGMKDVVAELTFQAPEGGLMSGVMRLYQGGKPIMLELISLVDGPSGVQLRFRHFDGALVAMESTFKQEMLIKTSTDSSDTFENTVAFDKTLMSTQPRVSSWTKHGANDMVAHSDILDTGGKPSTIDVFYHRTK